MNGYGYYGDDFLDDELVIYDGEFTFSDIPESDWSLCGNCHNYRPCGVCGLDFHEVKPDVRCTYNLKKEKKNE